MEFKAIVLCFAFFVVAASGASVCKCSGEEKKETVSKYTVKINDGNKEVEETVEIDTEKETETFRIPNSGDTSEEIEVIYDFKKNLAMYQVPDHRACFLSNSTNNLPKPDDLRRLLELKASHGPAQEKTTNIEYEIAGTLHDRSFLSDEMAALCAKLPIYRVKEKSVVIGVEKQKRLRKSLSDCVIVCTPSRCIIICNEVA